jgi:hypothetical protein
VQKKRASEEALSGAVTVLFLHVFDANHFLGIPVGAGFAVVVVGSKYARTCQNQGAKNYGKKLFHLTYLM